LRSRFFQTALSSGEPIVFVQVALATVHGVADRGELPVPAGLPVARPGDIVDLLVGLPFGAQPALEDLVAVRVRDDGILQRCDQERRRPGRPPVGIVLARFEIEGGRTMRLLLPLSSILLAAAPLLEASPQPLDRPGDDTFTGTLVAADDLSVTARAENGTLVTFTVDDPSSIPVGLVAGTLVTVRYEHTEGGGLRAVREGIASYASLASTESPPMAEKPQASDTALARRPSSPMAATSPVPKRPPSLEKQAETALSLEQRTPVRELPDPSTAVTAATASVQDSPQADGLVPPQRRQPLILALLLVLAGFLLIFASRRV
jgi:hypothetical protein